MTEPLTWSHRTTAIPEGGLHETREATPAERAAIQSWASFTIWEYGEPWGRWSLSESKSVNCDRTTSSEYSCKVSSRPCISRTARGRKR